MNLVAVLVDTHSVLEARAAVYAACYAADEVVVIDRSLRFEIERAALELGVRYHDSEDFGESLNQLLHHPEAEVLVVADAGVRVVPELFDVIAPLLGDHSALRFTTAADGLITTGAATDVYAFAVVSLIERGGFSVGSGCEGFGAYLRAAEVGDAAAVGLPVGLAPVDVEFFAAMLRTQLERCGLWVEVTGGHGAQTATGIRKKIVRTIWRRIAGELLVLGAAVLMLFGMTNSALAGIALLGSAIGACAGVVQRARSQRGPDALVELAFIASGEARYLVGNLKTVAYGYGGVISAVGLFGAVNGAINWYADVPGISMMLQLFAAMGLVWCAADYWVYVTTPRRRRVARVSLPAVAHDGVIATELSADALVCRGIGGSEVPAELRCHIATVTTPRFCLDAETVRVDLGHVVMTLHAAAHERDAIDYVAGVIAPLERAEGRLLALVECSTSVDASDEGAESARHLSNR